VGCPILHGGLPFPPKYGNQCTGCGLLAGLLPTSWLLAGWLAAGWPAGCWLAAGWLLGGSWLAGGWLAGAALAGWLGQPRLRTYGQGKVKHDFQGAGRNQIPDCCQEG